MPAPSLVPSDCRRGRSTFLLAYEFGWTRFDTHGGTPQPEGAGSWSSACKGLPKTTCRAVPFCTWSGTGLVPGERWASVEYHVLYVPSVASLLCVWLARLVRRSSETILPYFPGSPGVCQGEKVKGQTDMHVPSAFCVKTSGIQWLGAGMIGEDVCGTMCVHKGVCMCKCVCEGVKVYTCHPASVTFCRWSYLSIAKPTRLIAISNYAEHIYIGLWWHCFVCMSVMSALSAVILYSWCRQHGIFATSHSTCIAWQEVGCIGG